MDSEFDATKFRLGSLCKRGHEYNDTGKSLRYKAKGDCVECMKTRAINYYYNNRDHVKQRIKLYCDNNKGLIQKKNKQYNQNNKERIALKKKEYAQNNKSNIATYQREYYLKNGDRLKTQGREYRRNNPEIIRKRKAKYSLENRDKINEWFRNYWQLQKMNHTQIYIRQRLRGLVSDAFKRYSKTGKIMTSRQYGVNYAAIIAHLGPHPNALGIKGKFEIDHIIPLSAFDLNDPEQIKAAFAPENHQWLLAKENKDKGDRIIGQLNIHTQDQLRAVINAAR